MKNKILEDSNTFMRRLKDFKSVQNIRRGSTSIFINSSKITEKN